MNNRIPLGFAVLLLAAAPRLPAEPAPQATSPAAAAGDTTRYGQQLAEVQANMEKMQEEMAAIRATKDPTERQKLMQTHMATMQATMGLMHGMMTPGMMSCCTAGMEPGGRMMNGQTMGPGRMMGGGGSPWADPMQQRHRMMEQMVGMQQMMLQHMLDMQQMMSAPAAR